MPHSCSFKWNMLYNVVHPAWCLSPPWFSRSSARNGTKKSSKVNPSHEPARFLRTRNLVKTYCWFAASGFKISVRNRLLPEWGCGCVWECRTKDNKKVTLDVGLNIKNAVGGRRRRRARRCSRRRSNHPSVCVCVCVCVAQFRKIEDVDVIIINFFTSRTAYLLATAWHCSA